MGAFLITLILCVLGFMGAMPDMPGGHSIVAGFFIALAIKINSNTPKDNHPGESDEEI